MRKIEIFILLCLILLSNFALFSQTKWDTLSFQPFEWKSEVSSDCPFKASKEMTGIKLLGRDKKGNPIWTNDFQKIQPLLDWTENMGGVTITYNAPLKKYLMCVTDGGNTCAKMSAYILESEKLTGEWKLLTYMKDFGEQAYFVNIPSKFICEDGKTAWLLYSGNYATDWNGEK